MNLRSPIFVCRTCGVRLAQQRHEIYHEPLNNRELTFHGFLDTENVYLTNNDELVSSVHCEQCEQELGLRLGQEYMLFKKVVALKPQIVTLLLLSLKQELLDYYLDTLNDISVQMSLTLKIKLCLLTKASLDSLTVSQYDGAILVHKDESRLLLFNENGIYTKLHRDLMRVTQGNTLLVLESAINYDIEELAHQSQQPMLAVLWRHGRLIQGTNSHLPQFVFDCKSVPKTIPDFAVQRAYNHRDVEEEKLKVFAYFLNRKGTTNRRLLKVIKHENARIQRQNSCTLQ